MKLSSWGRLSHGDYPIHLPGRDNAPLPDADRSPGAIAFGMGRSYGDACLNPGGTICLTRSLDRFIHFDSSSGELVCEAGVTLGEIQTHFAPQGWLLPVTPGTQFVTVGGAIANDVHGKNHHRAGCFGNHLNWLLLDRSDGHSLRCSITENADYFAATIGGLGLTGIIKQASLTLRPVNSAWMDTETIAFDDLDTFFGLSASSEVDWEYAVSWIDCSSAKRQRGIFIRANHSDDGRMEAPPGRKLTVPFSPPLSPVNRLTVAAFNELYYRSQQRKPGLAASHYSDYFYPLDGILHWNRLYGPKGFHQYQLVVPHADGATIIKALIETVSRSGMGSFLSVLKTFGDVPSPGMLSFPMPGVTLALDFPNRGERSERLFRQLDALVAEAGGRLYPAKDARMPASLFAAGYPELQTFLGLRDSGLSSGLSRRLVGS